MAYVGALDIYTVAGPKPPSEMPIEEIAKVLARIPGVGEDGNYRFIDLSLIKAASRATGNADSAKRR